MTHVSVAPCVDHRAAVLASAYAYAAWPACSFALTLAYGRRVLVPRIQRDATLMILRPDLKLVALDFFTGISAY